MATLYVRNIPEELYRALRKRARQHHKTIAEQICTMLEESLPTASVLRKRKKIFRDLENLRFSVPPVRGLFPSSEEMQRGSGTLDPDRSAEALRHPKSEHCCWKVYPEPDLGATLLH